MNIRETVNVGPDLRMSKAASARFSGPPKVISGVEAVVPVSGLALELPMAEIYAGIATG
jgi:hypothetical protein